MTSEAIASRTYPRFAVMLHWIIAIGVLVLLATGAYMVGVPKNTAARGLYFNLHKSVGIFTGGFIILWIIWRSRHRAPELPATMPRWERTAAGWNHTLFYLLMVFVTAFGYLTSSFSAYGPKLFGIPLPHWGWDDPALRGRFADWHRLVAWIFAVSIVLHILAALKHLVFDRDGVFQRMLPERRSRSNDPA